MQNWTLVFDLDGTLVDALPDLAAATNHALSDLSLPLVPAETLRKTVGFGARRMIVEGLAQTGVTLPEPDVDRLLARFLDYYEPNIARGTRPFDGAIAALEGFRAEGARLAICTNKRFALTEHLLRELAIAATVRCRRRSRHLPGLQASSRPRARRRSHGRRRPQGRRHDRRYRHRYRRRPRRQTFP